MRKKKSWEQAKSAANLRISIFAFIIGMFPAVGTLLAFYGMFAAAKPENRWSDYKPKYEDSDDWSAASFSDETFGGFEEDLDPEFTYEDTDDESWFSADEVDVDDAYDYGTSSDASFDSSFVYGDDAYLPIDNLSPELKEAWKNLTSDDSSMELVDAWSFESTESMQEITDVEIQAFESSGLVLKERDAFEEAIAEALKTDAVGFVVEKVNDSYYVSVWRYDLAESWYTTGDRFELGFAEDFTDTVGRLIDEDSVDVLLAMAPTQIDTDMSPSRLFNRFDDRVTADYATNLSDWEGFYVQFDKWESNLNEHSLGFICCNDLSTNTRKYTALAYDARGNYLGETTYTTELRV